MDGEVRAGKSSQWRKSSSRSLRQNSRESYNRYSTLGGSGVVGRRASTAGSTKVALEGFVRPVCLSLSLADCALYAGHVLIGSLWVALCRPPDALENKLLHLCHRYGTYSIFVF